MKKVAFIHDFCFLRDQNDNYYTAVGMPPEYFGRFIDAGVDELLILSRCATQKKIPEGYLRISDTRIHFSKDCPVKYLHLLNLQTMFRIINLLKSLNYIVISLPSILGIYVLIINSITKRPYLIEVASDENMFITKKGGKAFTLLLKLLMGRFIRKARGAAYVTKYLSQTYPTNGYYIISSNVNIYSTKQKAELLLPLANKSIINIGFAGGLTKRKGIDTIIKMMLLMKQTEHFPKIRIHLIGGYSDADWPQTIHAFGLDQSFIFHGIVLNKKLIELLDQMDIYLQPSYSEGLPRATIEAMSRSLPVLATDLPGFKEILPHECLFRPGDYNLLFNKLVTLLKSANLWNEYSKQNFLTSKKFLYSALHKKRVSYYKSLLGLGENNV
jgi:glycosyltransferase involved in cell wall biosynthesis